MKERQILFSGPMVRAILEGRKTQTRRIVKFPKWMHSGEIVHAVTAMNLSSKKHIVKRGICDGISDKWNCPFGSAGDHLWVRENFKLLKCHDEISPSKISPLSAILFDADGENDNAFGRTRPSIHMPRWASRITLEVTGVRVERLQDISEYDAKKEGIPLNANNEDISNGIYLNRPIDSMWCSVCGGEGTHGSIGERYGMTEVECKNCDTDVKIFRNLWDSINADRAPWDSNPWVWVIEFKRILG